MLQRFQSAIVRLDIALGGLPLAELHGAEETQSDLANVRALLQRTTFQLHPGHQQIMASYRGAVSWRLPLWMPGLGVMLAGGRHTSLLYRYLGVVLAMHSWDGTASAAGCSRRG